MTAYPLTYHCLRQITRRGIPEAAVQAAAQHGHSYADAGRTVLVVTPAAALRAPRLQRWVGLKVIIGADGWIVTAYMVGPRREAS